MLLRIGVCVACLSSATAIANAPAALDTYVRQQMAALRIPGVQVAIVQHGHLALVRSYGVASVELDVAVRADTVFAVNSIAKAFTGVAAMRLVQSGQLDLGAPVGRYLRELPVPWQGVTIRQLLSHMSGLPDIMRAPMIESDAIASWEWVQSQPTRFAAGERFDYCQTNYVLLQRLINGLRGATPEAPAGGEQLGDAGLRWTRYGDSLDVIPHKAPTYRVKSAAGALSLQPVWERFLPFRYAASGLNTTATELAQWLIAVTGKRLLTPASREVMWTAVPFNNGAAGQWGLGWQILQRSTHRAVGMTGGGRAAFYLYPEHDIAVVILTNLSGAYPEDMVDAVATMFAPDIKLTGVPALRRQLEAEGYDKATSVAARLRAEATSEKWSEPELNDWGYRLLATGRIRNAVAVMKVGVEMFPMSGNAHDSLAEALARDGDVAGAIEHYRRSLALDPGNTNATRELQRLLK
jgi:CubicO group peptidase (beta-lactamase class C family)